MSETRTTRRTNGQESPSIAALLSAATLSDLSPGVYGTFAVFDANHNIPLREARRNTANNAMPEGVTRDRYSTTIGKMASSVIEELTRYHGHILNNQAESAMIAAKKAHDALPASPTKGEFDRVAALHKWRMDKIDEIQSENGLGVRAASAPALPLKERMERDEAFKMLRAAAVKGGQGNVFPDRLTATTLKQVVSKNRTLEAMIAALLATPVSGGAIKDKVAKLIAEQEKQVEAGDAEMAALFGSEDESEDDDTDESEGESATA